VYFLCLIDWERILRSEELKELTEKIVGSSPRQVNGWKTKPLEWQELSEIISKAELGFYHSRLIFNFDLKSTPKTIFEIRNIRERLESRIENYCSKELVPIIKSCNKEAKEPFIFTYPIFELNIQESFWKFGRQKPYSLPTTCFYTELDDRRGLPFFGKKVKMRISGAKIIASDMSHWFFENLVSIIFHEGLYRQTRDKKEGKLPSNKSVYNGLENRLEDFASKLMTTFHEYSSEYVRRNIQKIALVASGIAIFLTALNLALNLLR
jgi:hypothetical protein